MFYTINELRALKTYALDNATYNKIEDKCIAVMGSKKAKKMLQRMLERDVIEVYNCTNIDFTKCFNIK